MCDNMEEKEIVKKAVKCYFGCYDEERIKKELGKSIPIGEVRKIAREYIEKQEDPLSAIFESGAYEGLTLKPTSTPYEELSEVDTELCENEKIRRSTLRGELHTNKKGILKQALSIVFGDGDERTNDLLRMTKENGNIFGTYMSPNLIADNGNNGNNGKVMRSGLADFLLCISYLYEPIMVPLPPGRYTLQEIAFISELAEKRQIVPILPFNYKLYDFSLLDIIKDKPYIPQGLHLLLMYSGYNSVYNRESPKHQNIYNFLSSNRTIKNEIWPGFTSYFQDVMKSIDTTFESYFDFLKGVYSSGKWTHYCMTGEWRDFSDSVLGNLNLFATGRETLRLKTAPNRLLKEPFELVKIISEVKEGATELRTDIIRSQKDILSEIGNGKAKQFELMNELSGKYESLDKTYAAEYHKCGFGDGRDSVRTSIVGSELGILHSFAPFVGVSFADIQESEVIQKLMHVLEERRPTLNFNQTWGY